MEAYFALIVCSFSVRVFNVHDVKTLKETVCCPNYYFREAKLYGGNFSLLSSVRAGLRNANFNGLNNQHT